MRARSLLLVLLTGAVMAGSAGQTASAAEEIDPVVTYQGTLTMTFEDGAFDVTAQLVANCTTAPCTALITVLSGELVASPSNDQALPLIDGALSVGLPEYGSLCDLRWIGAGQLDVVVGPTTATVTRSSAPGGPVSCSDGSEATAGAATVTGSLTYQSGSVCALDDSCVVERPRPANAGTGREQSIAALLPQPDEPSSLMTLPTVGQAITIPAAAWAAGGAIVLGVLVGLPSVLLDSATERASARLEEARMRRGREPRPSWAAPPLTVLGWPLGVLGLIAAAIASAFVDPGFQFTLDGARSVVAILAAFIGVIALSWAFVGLVMTIARPASRPRVEFRPLTLLVVAAAVVFSRLTGLEPGVIFGLVAGIGFGAVLGVIGRGVAALLGVLFLLAASAAGWVGYGSLLAVFGSEPLWWQLLILETLAAVAMTGVSALPIALLPVRGLLGHSIWGWNKAVWALSYGLAIAAFLLMLLPLPDSWEEVGVPLQAWAIGVGAYALAAALVWLIVVKPWSRTDRGTNEA